MKLKNERMLPKSKPHGFRKINKRLGLVSRESTADVPAAAESSIARLTISSLSRSCATGSIYQPATLELILTTYLIGPL